MQDDWIATHVYGYLTANPPDIVLLHIGTNGLGSSATDVEEILNEIDQYESDSDKTVYVIVARIIDRVPNSAMTNAFNNNVEAMVNTRGDPDITMVDMEDGAGIVYQLQPAGDMWDTLHPYTTGYAKMATKWKSALEQDVFSDCNTQPEITTNLGNRTDAEGAGIAIDVNATDPDSGQTLTFSAANLPPGLSINAGSGVISGALTYLAASGSPYAVSVRATDDGVPVKWDEKTFTWTVTNTNRAPQVTDPGDQVDTEGDLVHLHISASDPDSDDTLTYNASNLPDGLAIDPVTGWIDGTLTAAAAANSPYNVQVTATDNRTPALSGTAAYTWTVNNINNAPQVTQPADQSHSEGQTVSLQIFVSDADPADQHSYSAAGLPAGLAIDPVTGLIGGTLTLNAHGQHPVTVTVSDNGAPVMAGEATFTWQVADANGPPQAQSPGDQANTEGDPVSLQIAASDPDNGDTLTFSASGLPDGLIISDSGLIQGNISSGASTGSPYTVTVSVQDSGGLSDGITFDWTITAFNHPPQLEDLGDQTGKIGESVSLALSASDPDGDDLTFSAAGLPPGLTIHAASGLISGVISNLADASAPYWVIVTVQDEHAESDSVTFAFQVSAGPALFLPMIVH
jgi:hypothetical protein